MQRAIRRTIRGGLSTLLVQLEQLPMRSTQLIAHTDRSGYSLAKFKKSRL